MNEPIKWIQDGILWRIMIADDIVLVKENLKKDSIRLDEQSIALEGKGLLEIRQSIKSMTLEKDIKKLKG